jgi:succinyldiaminopimelate transaminase
VATTDAGVSPATAAADAAGGATGAGGSGLVLPVYPFERLGPVRELAAAHEGGVVDLSVGTPCDPPPPAVLEALGSSGTERGYPSSAGSRALREAASAWVARRFGVEVAPGAVAACVGTKELVAGIPHWLRLRTPKRDTVFYPAIAYPTYAMGALLAGCRAVPVDRGADGSLALDAIGPADAARGLCLWVNSPGNPTGDLEDLAQAAAWGRRHGVPVLSDECYAEFTWESEPRTILSEGSEGVLALHSASKRSNLAGLRVGFYAGDPDLVGYLSSLRQHAGFMVPGPVQAAAVAAYGDDSHVVTQRERYRERMLRFTAILASAGVAAKTPGGSFYLWVKAAEADGFGEAARSGDTGREGAGWGFTRTLARAGGALVSPGDFYGPAGCDYVRIALVQPMDRIELVGERLGRWAAAGD